MSADISFSDALSRGLVSIQIAVQSEMATCTSQAKQISENIGKIQALISEATEKVL